MEVDKKEERYFLSVSVLAFMVSCPQHLVIVKYDDAEMGYGEGGTGVLNKGHCQLLSPCDSDYIRTLPNIQAKSYYFLISYLWLHWVFVAGHRLSRVAVNEGYSLAAAHGLILMVWFLPLPSRGSRVRGLQ